MTANMNIQFVHSRESQIDDKLEDLLSKLVHGGLSPEDEVLYDQLVTQRTRMMRPARRPFIRRNFARLSD